MRETRHEIRDTGRRLFPLSCLIVLLGTASDPAQDPAPRLETTVGMPGKLNGIVLPGPELVAKPYDDRKRPVVIQNVTVYPHGTAFRYDIEYFGLDPGTFNLSESLQHKDGTPATNLPPVIVKVNPIRPPGQVEPNKLENDRGPRIGGYRLLLIAGGIIWLLGLFAILGWMLWPLFRSRQTINTARPVSLADKLRPLVEGAIAGKLSQAELAGLERTLLAFWRKRLNLETVEPAEAMRQLRKHPDAGPLLGQLETWLHKPGPHEPVDVAALLRPYRDLPPDAADLMDFSERGALAPRV